jgi:hypothetical protein
MYPGIRPRPRAAVGWGHPLGESGLVGIASASIACTAEHLRAEGPQGSGLGRFGDRDRFLGGGETRDTTAPIMNPPWPLRLLASGRWGQSQSALQTKRRFSNQSSATRASRGESFRVLRLNFAARSLPTRQTERASCRACRQSPRTPGGMLTLRKQGLAGLSGGHRAPSVETQAGLSVGL